MTATQVRKSWQPIDRRSYVRCCGDWTHHLSEKTHTYTYRPKWLVFCVFSSTEWKFPFSPLLISQGKTCLSKIFNAENKGPRKQPGSLRWSAWLLTLVVAPSVIRPRLEVTQFYRGLKRIHVIEALELSEEQNRWQWWDGGSRNARISQKWFQLSSKSLMGCYHILLTLWCLCFLVERMERRHETMMSFQVFASTSWGTRAKRRNGDWTALFHCDQSLELLFCTHPVRPKIFGLSLFFSSQEALCEALYELDPGGISSVICCT